MGALTDGEREIMQELNNDAAAGWTTDDAEDEDTQDTDAQIAADHEAYLDALVERSMDEAGGMSWEGDHEPF